MSLVSLKRRWTRKPSQFIGLDASSQISKGMGVALNPANGNPLNLADNIRVSDQGAGVQECSGGLMRFYANANAEFRVLDTPSIDFSYLTVRLRIYLRSVSTSERWFSRGKDSATVSRYEFLNTGDTFGFGFYDTTTTFRNTTFSGALSVGWNDIVLTYDGSNVWAIINRKEYTSSVPHGAIGSTAGNDLYIGVYLNGGTQPLNGDIESLFIREGALNKGLAREWYKNRYLPFQPRTQYINIVTAAPPATAIPVFMNHYRNQGIS